jgi:hypothetical protein
VLGFDVVDADELKVALMTLSKTDESDRGEYMQKKQAFLDMVSVHRLQVQPVYRQWARSIQCSTCSDF